MNYETAIFAAGCFWGVEETFRKLDGVEQTEVGYAGGPSESTDYKAVCAGGTGHAEVVKLEFDPLKVSYKELLHEFFGLHNPTQVNRQGPDIGDQYRSAIFFQNKTQEEQAHEAIKELESSKKFDLPIATEVSPQTTYIKAEEYHQKYFQKQGGGACKLF